MAVEQPDVISDVKNHLTELMDQFRWTLQIQECRIGKAWANPEEGTFPRQTHLWMPISRSTTYWVHLYHCLRVLLSGIWKYPQTVSSIFLVKWNKQTNKRKAWEWSHHFPPNIRYKLLVCISKWLCFIYVTVWRTWWALLFLCALKWLDFFLFI